MDSTGNFLFDIADSYFISDDDSGDKTVDSLANYIAYLQVQDENHLTDNTSQKSSIKTTNVRRHRRRALLLTSKQKVEFQLLANQSLEYLTSDTSFVSAKSSFDADSDELKKYSFKIFDKSCEDTDEGCDISSISRESTCESVEVTNQLTSGYFADNEYGDVDSFLQPDFSVNNVNENLPPQSLNEKTPIVSTQSSDEHVQANPTAVVEEEKRGSISPPQSLNEKTPIVSTQYNDQNVQANPTAVIEEEKRDSISISRSLNEKTPIVSTQYNDQNVQAIVEEEIRAVESELEEGEIRTESEGEARNVPIPARRLFLIINSDESSRHASSSQLNSSLRRKDLEYLRSLDDVDINYRNRNAVTARCYDIFNKHVFSDQLPSNLQIYWNTKVHATLGLYSEVDRAISLSPKLLLKGGLLIEILLHTMIHAAVSLINRVPLDRVHHSYFYNWTSIVHRTFPQLHLLNRCPSSVSAYKWYYVCEFCNRTFKRQRNTIDVSKKRCLCGGNLTSYANGGPITCRFFRDRNIPNKSKVYCKLMRNLDV